MGRELRRKQAKREGKSLERENLENEHQIKKLLIITGLILFIAIIIYLLTATFITKELKWFDNSNENQTDTSSNKVSNSILASAIFKQKEEEYYVYFYDFNEEDGTITNTVNSSLSDSKVYKVDTSSAMNSNYVSETGNKEAKNLEELKVVPHTLIKIVADTITEYYENDEITNKLN